MVPGWQGIYPDQVGFASLLGYGIVNAPGIPVWISALVGCALPVLLFVLSGYLLAGLKRRSL